eukprot:gene15988-1723_t
MNGVNPHAVLPDIGAAGVEQVVPCPPSRPRPPRPPNPGSSLSSFAQLEKELLKSKVEFVAAEKVAQALKEKVAALESLRKLYCKSPMPPSAPNQSKSKATGVDDGGSETDDSEAEEMASIVAAEISYGDAAGRGGDHGAYDNVNNLNNAACAVRDEEMLTMLEAAQLGHDAPQKAADKINGIKELQAHARGHMSRKKLKLRQTGRGVAADASPALPAASSSTSHHTATASAPVSPTMEEGEAGLGDNRVVFLGKSQDEGALFEGTDEEIVAAAIIQAGYRGYRVRKFNRSKHDGVMVGDAVTADDVKYVQVDEEVAVIYDSMQVVDETHAAAASADMISGEVDIQAQDEEEMAEMLEAAQLGHTARQKAVDKIDAVKELQAHLRGKMARSKRKQLASSDVIDDEADANAEEEMAEMLEAAQLGHTARQKAVDKIDAVKELQAHLRGKMA